MPAAAGISDFLRPGEVDAPGRAKELLLGGPVREREELARLASPLSYVRVGVHLPPFLLLHGERDDVVPIAQSEALHQALRAVGAEVDFVRVPDADHRLAWPYVADLGSYWPLIGSYTLRFFTRHLGE